MTSARWGGFFVYFRTMALFVLVWHLAASNVTNKLLLPSPLAVAGALRDSALDLVQHGVISMAELYDVLSAEQMRPPS